MGARPIRTIMTAALTLALAAPLAAQNTPAALPGGQATGPIIQSSGMSFKVDDPTFPIPGNHVFKAFFVVSTGGGDTLKVNEQVTVMARYFNLHARNGIADDHVKAAAVFHGMGWPALLSDAAFTARFGGSSNPSRKVVEELIAHGATLVLCGQTAGNRGIHREELLPGVKVAISAMSATEVLQSQGFHLIPW